MLAHKTEGGVAPAKVGLSARVRICNDLGRAVGKGSWRPSPSRCSSVNDVNSAIVLGMAAFSGTDVSDLMAK